MSDDTTDRENSGAGTTARTAGEVPAEWAAVVDILSAAYDLGRSGDPAESTDPEQIRLRLRLVAACEVAGKRIDTIRAERDRYEEAIAIAVGELSQDHGDLWPNAGWHLQQRLQEVLALASPAPATASPADEGDR